MDAAIRCSISSLGPRRLLVDDTGGGLSLVVIACDDTDAVVAAEFLASRRCCLPLPRVRCGNGTEALVSMAVTPTVVLNAIMRIDPADLCTTQSGNVSQTGLQAT